MLILFLIVVTSVMLCCVSLYSLAPCWYVVPSSSVWCFLHLCRCGVLASVFMCVVVVKSGEKVGEGVYYFL
jgi:hypothetical protein